MHFNKMLIKIQFALGIKYLCIDGSIRIYIDNEQGYFSWWVTTSGVQ